MDFGCVDMMCQCRFLSCNKSTTLVGDVDNGGIMHFWRGREYMRTLYLPLYFAVNLKLLWIKMKSSFKKFKTFGTSLVAQWLRILLPMQGTQVWALGREDPTCHGATKPMSHNYWACALEPASHNYWAHVPQLLKPACLEPVLRNKRSHHNEKPAHHNKE